MTSTFGEINESIRELHEAAMHLGSREFRAWALAHLRSRVQFDAAWWSVGLADGNAPPHDVVIHGSASEAAAQHTTATSDAGPLLVRHAERAGTEHLCLLLEFQRDAGAPPFDPREREMLSWLASHACTAWRSGEQRLLLRRTCPPHVAVALADREGCVRSVQGNFYTALRASWPEWNGGRLPLALRVAFRPGAMLSIRGYRWSVSACDGLLLVAAHPLGAVAALTAREKAVAAAVLDAGSQRLAATRLRISAHTVRNTLARVYTKLGVRGRVELAMRFRPELLRAGANSE